MYVCSIYLKLRSRIYICYRLNCRFLFQDLKQTLALQLKFHSPNPEKFKVGFRNNCRKINFCLFDFKVIFDRIMDVELWELWEKLSSICFAISPVIYWSARISSRRGGGGGMKEIVVLASYKQL